MSTEAANSLKKDEHSNREGQALLALCKASADQLRLDILRLLSRDSFGVLELCRIFDSKQSGMSHHLKILANAGLVTSRREGNSIFYRRSVRAASDNISELQQALHKAVDQLTLSPEVQQQVELAQQERAENSKSYFAQNADKFEQQQEQIAAYELYGPSAVELISNTMTGKHDTVLEVGPGEGKFLAELSPRFNNVYGLDNSQHMLDKAQLFTDQQDIDNVELIHGDTQHETLASMNADCIVVNMVLHHVPSPAAIFFDLAKALRKGGQLFVTDLCNHDQAWVQESCGDLWLGFEPEDLASWAADAGFQPGESIYLAQRNGFRVQIRQFIYQ